MAGQHVISHQLRALRSREFWSFRVIHAVLGGLLTIAGAAGALFIVGGLRNQVANIDDRLAALNDRIQTIGNTLAQFRIVQSNGVILGAISTADAINPAFRESFVQLMFNLRRSPALALVVQSDPDDLEGFRKAREELDRLIEIAVSPARTSQSWNDVVNFEMAQERQLLGVEEGLLAERARLEARKRELQSAVDAVTLIGFVVQQIGFVVVLLAGLVHEHAAGAPPGSSPRQKAEADAA